MKSPKTICPKTETF